LGNPVEVMKCHSQTLFNFSLFYFSFKQDQQDAMLHNGIYHSKYSTCFRRFLRPSSGAQNCIHSTGCLSSLFSLLTAIV